MFQPSPKTYYTYYFLARTYAPDECRFWQPDPQSSKYHWLSPYSYCGGDPINRVDMDGKDWVSRVYAGVTEYYYDRLVKSQNDADREYGYGIVKYIPDGTPIEINGDIYTFNNDLHENKYGTVSKNGVLLDNSKIYEKASFIIFGTTDNSCDAKTLHNNYFWTSYTGPDNPLDYNGDSNYQYNPRNRSEYGSVIHDKMYDLWNAKGVKGAMLNNTPQIMGADFTLILLNSNNFKDNPSVGDQLRIIGANCVFTALLILKNTLFQMGVVIKE